MATPHLRIARATDNLTALADMYKTGLGFEIIGQFEDHDGFDGIMLGHRKAGYHLEFTHHRGHSAEGMPGPETLLVFYLPDPVAWQTACDKMLLAGFKPIPAYNPYWDRRGRTFVDVDGYRVVLQNAAWGTSED